MKKLVKVDPAKQMTRWYTVGIQSTLLEGLAVIYGWGSLKSSFQQWRHVPVTTFEQAEKLNNQIVEARGKKGYKESNKYISDEDIK